MTAQAALELRGIDVKIGGAQILSEVSITAPAGSITGLIGPNGAGKTTLFDVATGFRTPTRGRVFVGGRDVTGAPPHRRARLGLGRSFQRLETFGTLTVLENVLAAAEQRHVKRASSATPVVEATRLLASLDLEAVAGDYVHELPLGTCRLVELARALAARPQVVLFDEPSSGLDSEESKLVSEVLRTVADGGVGIVLVEHDLELVMSLCTEIHVLDVGRVIATGDPQTIRRDPAVRRAYLGTDE